MGGRERGEVGRGGRDGGSSCKSVQPAETENLSRSHAENP